MIPALFFIPPVIAHRGTGDLAPENTLAAIRMAREQGANWVEFDVKITYDGVPILMHDETLDRTTDGLGLVCETTWESLKGLKARHEVGDFYNGENVPHLADALSVVIENKLSLLIEIKPCPGRAKATTMVAMIELAKIWPEKDSYPVVSSFDMECLEMAAQLEPHWPRCVLCSAWDDDWASQTDYIGASAISFPHEELTAERVQVIRDKGISPLAYTVNDPERAKELLAWGVAAVYSDKPRLILDRL